jgi:glycosyltransferase involved in cell wall biosynthesis
MLINIFIPAYNESCNIVRVLDDIAGQVKNDHRVIVIDDYSEDNTADMIKECAQGKKNICAVYNRRHTGFAALFKQAISMTDKQDVFLPVMADGCDDIALIDRMYAQIGNGFDIVCASRYQTGGMRIGGGTLKGLGSRIIGSSLYKLKGIPCCDMTNAFKMYRCSLLRQMTLESKGFEISFELFIKSYEKSARIFEMPTIWHERKKGRSSFRLVSDGLKYLRWVLYGLRINT